VTSFHHQPEAQHPKSSAIHKPQADYPIFGSKASVLALRPHVRSYPDSDRNSDLPARWLSANRVLFAPQQIRSKAADGYVGHLASNKVPVTSAKLHAVVGIKRSKEITMDHPEPPERAQPIEYWSQLSAQCEKSGDYLGAFDAAFLGLEQFPNTRELQYRAILNVSRTGANKRAKQLWNLYRLSENPGQGSPKVKLDENIAALGARLDREEAFAASGTERTAKLRRAAEHYDSIYQRTKSTFLAINAAVLYELSGRSVRAKELAARIVAECRKVNPRSQEDAYQLLADRSAASLLLDDLSDAQRAIERTAAMSTNAASIASTRKQLVQICDHKQIGREILTRSAIAMSFTTPGI
jgi:hypothetical protein